MTITKPAFYDTFHCIAGNCPDSCCKEWDVQVDAEAAAHYRQLPGALGDRLREVLKDENGETVMTIVEGRCPMWRSDGLCRIQAELGEEALCKVCREFPRLTHDYGDFVELGLELSCPEAARIILNAAPAPKVVLETEAAGEADYDMDAMAVLKSTREKALVILESEYTVEERLELLLLYGVHAQEELDGGEDVPFSASIETAKELAKTPDFPGFLAFFNTLEQLTPQWGQLLREALPVPLPEQTAALARYLIDRYWLQAVSDYDLVSRVKFILISCILVGYLPGDYVNNAQLFSKEIENDADNVDALLDAAYTEPAFTDDKLLGMLVGQNGLNQC